jgi:hypothetical protein
MIQAVENTLEAMGTYTREAIDQEKHQGRISWRWKRTSFDRKFKE